MLIKTKAEIMAIPPPIRPAKKFVKKCKHIFEIKFPKIADGIAINTYFTIIGTNLKLKFGTDFLIFKRLSKEIVVIDSKKDTITEFIPMIGVKAIKLTNRTTEPII